MEELIQTYGELQSLMVTQRADRCAHDFSSVPENLGWPNCGRIKLADLATSLAVLCPTLEELALVRSHAQVCIFDMSVLPPLTGFVKLRTVRIDLAYLLGYKLCCADPQQGCRYR